MRVALMTHPDQIQHGLLLTAPEVFRESAIPVARAQGWVVLLTESELCETPLVPVQSNPRRRIDREDRHGPNQ